MTQEVLTTERLRLEPLREPHRSAAVALMMEPEISHYLAADFTQRAQAEASVQRRLDYRGLLGHWAFMLDGELVGVGHLRPSESLPGELPEIGWFLSARHGGRGLATEAARTLLDYGLQRLTSVWALVHVDNAASLRLAERLGFLAVGSGVHYGAEHRVHVALPPAESQSNAFATEERARATSSP